GTGDEFHTRSVLAGWRYQWCHRKHRLSDQYLGIECCRGSSISQIKDAIHHLDGVTQANAGIAGEMATAIQELEDLSKAAAQTVRVFRFDAQVPEDKPDAAALRRQYKQKALLAAGA